MTTSQSAAALDAYRRPPYLSTASVPRWHFRDVLLPWRLARRIYGPYRFLRFKAADLLGPVSGAAGGPLVQPLVKSVAEEALDPFVERLLTPRALLGLGIVLTALHMVFGAGPGALFEDGFEDAVLVAMVGPLALLLVSGALVLLAYPQTRRAVTALVVRPVLTGLLTAAVFAAMMLSERFQLLNGSFPGRGFLSSLLALAAMTWLVVFTLCVLFLVHRNTFTMRAHPLVRPLVSTALAWLTALGHLLVLRDVGRLGAAVWLAGVLAGPLGVTASAAVDVVRLRRRHGVGFRGPLPA